MVNRMLLTIIVAGTCVWISENSAAQTAQTILADADATVRIICRNNYPEGVCFTPLGANNADGEDRFIRVHDQNQLETGYWHFDLQSIPAGASIKSARFQLDIQTNAWGDTTVSVLAIVPENQDWNLTELAEDQIVGANAPKSDYGSFEWTGDPTNPQRFNQPTPFLDEGSSANSEVRELSMFLLIENQDPTTDQETNEYGGYAAGDGPGTFGSADGDDNIWPVKNAVDIDVTDLIKWKFGQNSGYSTFTAADRELTILVRTDTPLQPDNGFVRFISKESNFLGGPLDLRQDA